MAEPPIGANLRAALEERGWSYTRLIAEMRRVAAREHATLPTTQSLIVMLSRWFNDHERPSEFYPGALAHSAPSSPSRRRWPCCSWRRPRSRAASSPGQPCDAR